MKASRLSTLDASFLAVESETAHMHVGWIAIFSPPADRPAPGFEELREHVAARLWRSPRFRQKLLAMPLGLSTPVWVDDPEFDLARHVVRDRASRLDRVVATTMSEPLGREGPLWQITIADRLAGGDIAVVGKAHHCMVDGIAAVELAALLVDADPHANGRGGPDWRAAPPPSRYRLLLEGARDSLTERLRFAARPLATLRSRSALKAVPGELERIGAAALDALRPARPAGPLNRRLTAERHVGTVRRELEDLQRIKRAHGTTLNDVLLAAVAGALRRYLRGCGLWPPALKTMVPVNVRAPGEAGGPGNRISFMFVDLPCDEPEPLRRLRDIHLATAERKGRGVAAGNQLLLDAAAQLPHLMHGAIARGMAAPRTFNLVVSNIPGPSQPLYMHGCRLEAAYPVVPLAEHHTLSVGMTTIGDRACFGLYADREAIPEVGGLATALEDSIDELLATVPAPEPPPRSLSDLEPEEEWTDPGGVPV